MTKRRDELMESTRKKVFPESDDMFMMTNTSSAYPVVIAVDKQLKAIAKIKDLKLQ